jgi:transglutaminase-like putative cysteine protease
MSMLKIRHETLYRYTESLGYTIQQLRLIPRADLHQHTLSWNISTPGRRHAFKDAFGNLSLMLTITEPHDEVRIIVDGMVDVLPLDRGRLAEKGELSPLVFTVPTRLTQPNAAIVEFARRALPENPAGADFLSLAHAIRDAVAYETGSTDVTSTAADALQLGRGVCQDHVHLFLACCHIANTPARYVSGYIDAGATLHAESHAWVDVWVEEGGFSGWTSIDVTHAKFADTDHCRLAVGRDYDSASPVRGIRRGGGAESLEVEVSVALHLNTQ